MDTTTALQAFAKSVHAAPEDRPGPVVPLPNAVAIRPVGAQAITVRRNPSNILADLQQNAAAFGDEWVYSWDVNDKHSKRPDGKTTIEGPTVKLANDLARTYGNCTAEIFRVDDIGSHWVFFARFVDFESGYEYVRPFQQRKAQTAGTGMHADRQRDIAFQIGASKAIRNCVTNALGSYTDFAVAAAKQSVLGRVTEKLPEYRARVIERLEGYGALKRVEKTWAQPAKDWDARLVAKLIAQLQSVNEGMTTIEELYPDPDAPPPGENKPRQIETDAPATQAQDPAQNAPAAGKTENAKAEKKPAAKPATKKAAKDNPPATGNVAEKGAVPGGAGPAVPARDGAAVDGSEKPDTQPPADTGAAASDPSDPAETCPHCGATDGTHFEDCPLLSKRPEPADKFDAGATADDPLALPAFLGRKDPAPSAVVNEAEIRAAAVAKYPGMSKPWLDGYVARAAGRGKTDCPDYAAQGLSPMAVRHYGAGWDARDMEGDRV